MVASSVAATSISDATYIPLSGDIRILYAIPRAASEEGDFHGAGPIHDGGQRTRLKLAHFGVVHVRNRLAQEVWGK
jgi:hypothetical protein